MAVVDLVRPPMSSGVSRAHTSLTIGISLWFPRVHLSKFIQENEEHSMLQQDSQACLGRWAAEDGFIGTCRALTVSFN